MNKLENWNEVTKGLYRYVIATNVAYEIHVLYWQHDTDILTSKCNLYVVGDWRTDSGRSFLERELLLSGQPFFECIQEAIRNNSVQNGEG